MGTSLNQQIDQIAAEAASMDKRIAELERELREAKAKAERWEETATWWTAKCGECRAECERLRKLVPTEEQLRIRFQWSSLDDALVNAVSRLSLMVTNHEEGVFPSETAILQAASALAHCWLRREGKVEGKG